MDDIKIKALDLHEKNRGKLEIRSKVSVNNADDLALAYTPGVAEPCKKIYEDKSLSYKYTNKANQVAVVTDGSAVLGLGNIGSLAGMPVMEGKCVLFKEFAGIDAFPICLDTQDVDKIVEAVSLIAPSFGGINLEDISAPKCFEIENILSDKLDIPVFHDDQHGTAIVVLAGIINSLKIVEKKLSSCKIVISGAGAAGIAIANLLSLAGAKNILLLNRKGILDPNDKNLDDYRLELAKTTNPNRQKGSLEVAIKNADIFIGVSGPGILTGDMVRTMNKDSIVFALANPVPEIYPKEALGNGARIAATGRSDFPNQVNNVLVFPGIFRGALDCKASKITDDMKLSVARAISNMVENPREDRVLPDAFDRDISKRVAEAVVESYRKNS